MTTPATPHPASTVVLVRPGADGGAEIFMNRRPEKMETYAGAYVFPGGRVEEADWSEKMLELVRGSRPGRRILGATGCEVCLGYGGGPENCSRGGYPVLPVATATLHVAQDNPADWRKNGKACSEANLIFPGF
jgi:hypothetical protein